jgi:hypothetical protein
MSLAWIPKGVLDKARKTCFKFLWVGSHDQFVLPWVKWILLAIPKYLGNYDPGGNRWPPTYSTGSKQGFPPWQFFYNFLGPKLLGPF